MDSSALYQALGTLIEDQPDVDDSSALMYWLGRAQALVDKVSPVWAAEIQAISSVHMYRDKWQMRDRTTAVLYRALAVVEIDAPVQQRGSFIQAGNELDALAGASKVLKSAKRIVRIVDPYMDETVLTDFAVLPNESVSIELLSDPATVKASFGPAVARFRRQFASTWPLEARLTSPRQLHDRLIFIDADEVFTVSQSLKDLAKRAHASIIKVEPELAALKLSAYEEYWSVAVPLT